MEAVEEVERPVVDILKGLFGLCCGSPRQIKKEEYFGLV